MSSPERARRWPPWARLVAGVGAAVGALYCVVTVLNGACIVQETARIPSPDETHAALVDLDACRQRGVPNVVVSVERSAGPGRGASSETVFAAPRRRAADDESKPPLHVDVVWTKNHELQI